MKRHAIYNVVSYNILCGTESRLGDEKMQIRNAVIEYDLEEAAAMLDISPEILKWAVNVGHLQYYYRLHKTDYRFHEASLRANKELLSEDDYLTELRKAFALAVPEAEPPSE